MLKKIIKYHLNIPNCIIGLCIFVVIVTLGMLLFPGQLAYTNKYLEAFYNIIAFTTLLFAVIAALISALAYKKSVLRPNLSLNISQYLNEKNEFTLPVNKNSGEVPLYRPKTEYYLTLQNRGEVSAQYPLVQIIFESQFFRPDAFYGWEPVYHSYGNGYYGFQWNPKDVIIYPGVPIKLPTLIFSEKRFQTDKKFAITFKYAADGSPVKEINIPVRFEYCDEPVKKVCK